MSGDIVGCDDDRGRGISSVAAARFWPAIPTPISCHFWEKMTDAEKKENTDEAVAAAEAGEVLAPYSIYGNREKWMIVGMVALAGFYRYVKDFV
jgi:hypothetical protein